MNCDVVRCDCGRLVMAPIRVTDPCYEDNASLRAEIARLREERDHERDGHQNAIDAWNRDLGRSLAPWRACIEAADRVAGLYEDGYTYDAMREAFQDYNTAREALRDGSSRSE